MKKGAYDIGRKAIYMLLVVFVLAVIFLNANNIFSKYQQRITQDASKIENRLILLEMTTSPKCLAYEDPETKRVYQGVIDIRKFDAVQLRKDCVKFVKKKFYVELGDLSKRVGDTWDSPPLDRQSRAVFIRKEEGTMAPGYLLIYVENV